MENRPNTGFKVKGKVRREEAVQGIKTQVDGKDISMGPGERLALREWIFTKVLLI